MAFKGLQTCRLSLSSGLLLLLSPLGHTYVCNLTCNVLLLSLVAQGSLAVFGLGTGTKIGYQP